jgi:23S rRNA (cytosine1962-C5)-methyltransferase
MPKSAEITLKPGRDKSVHHRHPWLFSGAIDRVDGHPEPGDIVRVRAANGEFLAHAYYNSRSQIALRLLSWDEFDTIDGPWWTRMVERAIARRLPLSALTGTNSYRVIYSEADGLPGLIVDRYANFLVCQFLTAGIERVRAHIVDVLWERLHPSAMIEQSDNDVRKLEGLAPSGGVIRGAELTGPVMIQENGFRYAVDLGSGQKTGYYLDQRRNRAHVAAFAAGRRVLDCFCYTGGFTVPILASSPASVTCIDSSEPALGILRTNIAMLAEDHPELAVGETEFSNANVFEELRRFRDQDRRFDLIVLDPPKLAASQSQTERAKRAYKDLNLLAIKLLSPRGILATFSCSGAITRADLQSVVGWAATDAKRRVQVVDHLGQGEDHPVLVSFPESEYLKGLICIID